MYIKIGNITLGEWEINKDVSLYRSSLVNSESDYVGFFARSVTFGTHHENVLWQPNFGDGPFSHLRNVYFKTLDLRKTWLFPLSKAEETMKYMDEFLIKMGRLTVFL